MISITAQMRDPSAKAKHLRRAGFIPCVIYGSSLEESLSVQIDESTARKLRQSFQSGSKVSVKLEEKSRPVLIKEIVSDSISGEIVHISFHVLDKGKKYNSVADVVPVNRDSAQGIVELIQLEVPHAAEPDDLIDTVTVDVSELPVGTVLTVGDIPEFCSDKIELLADPANIVLRIRDKNRTGKEIEPEKTE